MRFKPINVEEAEKAWESGGKPLKEGECNFEVKVASTMTSQAGNEMIKLELVVTDGDGGSDYIFDYLVYNDKQMCQWKIARFCTAAGLLEELEEGNLPHFKCLEKSGRCIVKMEQGKDYKNRDGDMVTPDPRNTIKEYLKPLGKADAKRKEKAADAKKEAKKIADNGGVDPEFDDDIPF